jgi:hypothetical protein
MFWTMDESDGIPSVTLCETHALEATNIGATMFGLGPWETMEAAALELEMLTAVFGGEEKVGFDFHTSEIGHCAECDHRAALAQDSAGGDVA